MFLINLILLCNIFSLYNCFPDPGQWSGSYIKTSYAIFGTHKPLYTNSNIYLTVSCEPYITHQTIEVQWVIRQTSCYEEYLASNVYTPEVLEQYFLCPMNTNSLQNVRYFISKPLTIECSNRIHLDYVTTIFKTSDRLEVPYDCESYFTPSSKKQDVPDNNITSHAIQNNPILQNKGNASGNVKDATPPNPLKSSPSIQNDTHSPKKRSVDEEVKSTKEANYHHINMSIPFFSNNPYGYVSGPFSAANNVKLGSKLTSVDMNGIYLFILKINSLDDKLFNVSVDVAMKGDHGFLSAIDYPLLIFYGIMCGLYVLYAIIWLVMSALQWRDLLRIQFWIGAVILLGLMEKAVFYAEYQSINYSGQSVQGAILFAEILSCMKRTLARMLIIIVSLGFGIVKPRLGSTLHRIIGVGVLYFFFGTIEGCLRVLKPKTDPGNQALMAGIPLAVTDGVICWWIFSSLVQTIRTLQLRRNIVKLQLYRHFTNTLILSVIGSVGFMTWSIHAHRLVNCISDWKELWVDEAYWHFLFSIILFAIIILWRPTNNNQRYAFTPLLDAMDDEDEDDTAVSNEVFDGMKMRMAKNNISPKNESKSKLDEDLKWVEENIPTSLTEVALPTLLDSDEEIMTAKFERSKME